MSLYSAQMNIPCHGLQHIDIIYIFLLPDALIARSSKSSSEKGLNPLSGQTIPDCTLTFFKIDLDFFAARLAARIPQEVPQGTSKPGIQN